MSMQPAPGVTAETLAAMQLALAGGNLDADVLAKATTQGFQLATGLQITNLEKPAKSLFPVLAPLRNRIPRSPSNGGSAVNWKAITAINTAKLKAGVAEGVRNSVVSTTEVDKLASYKSFGLDESVTFESQIDGKNFQDVRALAAANLLSAVMIEEEKIILGGNVTAIGKPASVAAASGAGGSLANSTTYDYSVSALTLYGYLNGATGHGAADAADETDARTGSTATGGAGTSLAITWPAVRGAVAYNVYAGTSGGTKFYIATVTAPAYTLLALVGSGNVANTLDKTADALSFDGIIPQISASAGGAYWKDLANAQLTADNAGGIPEIDAMLQSLYDTSRITPTAFLVNSQQAGDGGKRVATGTSTTQVQLVQSIGADGQISGGLTWAFYRNKYFGGRPIPIITHPYAAPGSIYAITENLPYPNTNVPNPFEIDVALDYTQYDWALVQRKWEFGVYGREALKVYFPAGCGVITGIKAG